MDSLEYPLKLSEKNGEHLKNLEHQGRVMPTFKDVVNFLKDFGYYKRELWFVKFCESVSAAISESSYAAIDGDLPKERLIPFEPPFTYTVVDFFGAFHVKRGRSAEKVYGCLLTYFTSCAVHIEDVSSLETDSFIQALRRCISNRGYPKEIWSANATNFAGAEKEI